LNDLVFIMKTILQKSDLDNSIFGYLQRSIEQFDHVVLRF
jgi:hypothetical protein